MPIRPGLRPPCPAHWRELSRRVRFERACGRSQGRSRPHHLAPRWITYRQRHPLDGLALGLNEACSLAGDLGRMPC